MSASQPPADLATLTRVAAETWPERTAWIFDAIGERLTFADVDRRSDELATALAAHDIGEGDRVAVMLGNRPEFPLLWLALAKRGAVLVALNTNYRELDGGHVVAHSGARLAVADEEFVPLLRRISATTALEQLLTVDELANHQTVAPGRGAVRADPIGVPPERIVNIQYTSGTTGTPKGCELSHRYWTTLAGSLTRDHPGITAEDVILTAQPFHYIDPQWNVALGLASGATLVVLDRFHPDSFWAKVREYEVSWFYCLGLMPTLLLATAESQADTRHNVRAISASAIPPELHAALERRWGVPWYECFGMTETGGDIRMSPNDHDETVGTGCIGRPITEREAMIVDASDRAVPRGTTGELAIRGVGLMHGYHADPDATALAFRNGWFHTGDNATMDEHGRIHYVGRSKDMIRRSGENIAADEVERALLLHPAVRLAAVLAVPDELRGEEVKAYVVPTGSRWTTPEELAEFCTAKLAYFKVPRYWAYVDTLPTTPSERVAKGQLRAQSDDLRAGSYDRKLGGWL